MSVEILFLNLAKSLQDQVLKGLSLWYIVEGLDTSRTENTTLLKSLRDRLIYSGTEARHVLFLGAVQTGF